MQLESDKLSVNFPEISWEEASGPVLQHQRILLKSIWTIGIGS